MTPLAFIFYYNHLASSTSCCSRGRRALVFCYTSAMTDTVQYDAQQDKGLTLVGIVFNFHLHLPRVRLQRHQPTLEVLLLTVLGVFQGDVPLQGETTEERRVDYKELYNHKSSKSPQEQQNTLVQCSSSLPNDWNHRSLVSSIQMQSFLSSLSRLGQKVAVTH